MIAATSESSLSSSAWNRRATGPYATNSSLSSSGTKGRAAAPPAAFRGGFKALGLILRFFVGDFSGVGASDKAFFLGFA